MTSKQAASAVSGYPVDRRFPAWFAAGMAVAALGLQTFLPTLHPAAGLINLPFLTVMYLALTSRATIPCTLAGMLVGWTQDGLLQGPIGLYGLAYTVVAFSAAAGSQFLKMELTLMLGALVGLAYWAHELILYGVQSLIIGQQVPAELALWTVAACVHGGLAILAFPLLQRWTRQS